MVVVVIKATIIFKIMRITILILHILKLIWKLILTVLPKSFVRSLQAKHAIAV